MGKYNLEELKQIAEALNDSPPMQDMGVSIDVSAYTDVDELTEAILSAFEENVPENREREVPKVVIKFYEDVVPQDDYYVEPEPEEEVKDRLTYPFYLSDIKLLPILQIKENSDNMLFPVISEEEREALKEDIQEKGILIPLVLNQDNTLLGGHIRYSIAKELGFDKVPVRYVSEKLDEEEAIKFMIRDNLLRRQLTKEQKKELIKRLYGKELYEDRRGGDRKTEKATVKGSIAEKIEKETGIPTGTAKGIVSEIRKEKQLKKESKEKVLIRDVKKSKKYLDFIKNNLHALEKAKLIQKGELVEAIDVCDMLIERYDEVLQELNKK